MDDETRAPLVTHQIQDCGPETVGHATNLARAPMWVARASDKPVQLTLLSGPLVMHAVDFRQVEGPQLTVGDQRLVAELTTRFLRDGCPDSRVVHITLREAAEALGFESSADSGKGHQAAKRSLARIRAVTFSSALSAEDKFPAIWGLIDNADPISPPGGRPRISRDAGYVTLNKRLAELLRKGNVTFLHYPTWDAISREDAVAGRLWCYLEAERIRTGWNYSLFAGPTNGGVDERYMPAIADMLLLDWPYRPKIAWRVRRACDVIARLDPRYELEVVKSKAAGMWSLRTRRSRRALPRPVGPLPHAVHHGWRSAYGRRNPSSKQASVLNELAARRGAEWVGEQLSLTREDDSFEVTMRRDRELSAEALRRADDDEREWQKAKARENATADESIASIIGRLVETGTFRNVDNAPETRTPRNIGSAETRTSGNRNPYFRE